MMKKSQLIENFLNKKASQMIERLCVPYFWVTDAVVVVAAEVVRAT